MRERTENLLLGILFGLLGAWMSLVGAGLLKTSLPAMQGPIQVASGLLFFFAGAWSFFRGSLGPGGQDLPVFPWIQYFLVLPILADFGIIMVLAGTEAGETMLTLLGVLPLLGAAWFAIAKFPGRRSRQ
jgi:hypothetical protein